MRCTVMVVLALLAGCADETYELSEADARQYAEARCSGMWHCCDIGASPDCVESLVDEMLHYERPRAGELTFSGACMDEVLDWSGESIGCAPHGLLDGPNCRLAHGRYTLGAPCLSFEAGLRYDRKLWTGDLIEGVKKAA